MHFEATFYPCMAFIALPCIGNTENIVSMNLLIFQMLSKSVIIIRKLTWTSPPLTLRKFLWAQEGQAQGFPKIPLFGL